MAKKWDPHKEEILRLYLVENMTLDQVMGHMLQTHDFDQKKPHYEYRLKLWGARKNLKKEVLEYISHEDRKRRPSQDLNSGTYIVDGILLSETRVKRARRRHDLGLSLARKYGRAPSPKLPPGHVVRRAYLPTPEIVIDWPKSMPWLRFEERFNIVAPQSSKFIQVLAQAARNENLICRVCTGDVSDLSRAIYAATRETDINATNLTRMLPYIPHGSQSSMIDISLSNPNDVATKMLKVLLFKVSNKLGPDDYINSVWSKDLLSVFQELDETNPMALDRLINSDDSTSEAIMQSLYEAALEYGATALVSRFWKTGRDLNELLSLGWRCYHNLFRGKAVLNFNQCSMQMTALQCAAKTCNIQLATMLIDAGAKADLGNPTPLQILCSSSEIGHTNALHFARLLVSNGARVNIRSDMASPLEGATFCRNMSLVHFLLQHGATDTLNRSGARLYYKALRNKKCDFVIPGEDGSLVPTSALQLAIMLRDGSIARTLITSIKEQGDQGAKILKQAFITACVAGDQGLAEVILENIDSQLEGNQHLTNAAFFAAAWDTDCRIAQLLVEHEIIRRNLQDSCLPIFQAAALHGNISLIMLLHSSGFDVNSGSRLDFGLEKNRYTDGREDKCRVEPPLMSVTPLGCAVWMNQKYAIRALLDIEADMDNVDLITAIRTRSNRLITHALKRCDNLNRICNGQSALDLAVRLSISLRMIRKLIDAGAIPKGHEIVDAVRRNDQQVVSFFLPSCDILAINPNGENVLEAACCTGNLEIALNYFARGGVYGSRALILAASRAVKTHDYRIMEHLVANRTPGPIDGYEASALALSIRMDDTTIMDMLLNDDFEPSSALSVYAGRFNPHSSDFEDTFEAMVTPLDYENLSLDIREIARRPDWTPWDGFNPCFSPMLVAAARAQERVVKKLLEHGYLPDPYLINEICCCSSFATKEVRDLTMSAYKSGIPNVADQEWHQGMLMGQLMHGWDLEILQQHFTKLTSLDFEYGGESPLRIAIENGDYDYVKALLEAGATADVRKWPGAADVWKLAIIDGTVEIVSLLLDHSADINDMPVDSFTDALDWQDFQMVAFLLDHGLDVNAPPSERRVGRTCLETAAEKGKIDAIELLFSHGLEIQGRARIHFVRSVVFATQLCHYAVAKLLKERGGWTVQDGELARTPRGRETVHTCPRFLHDDLTLERCEECEDDANKSSIADDDNDSDNDNDEDEEEDEDEATNSPHHEVANEDFALRDTSMGTGDMSLLHFESEFIDYEQTNETPVWPLTHYGQQDTALDASMLDIDSAFNYHQHTNEVYEWPILPFDQQDMELDAIIQQLLLEDDMIS